LNHYLKILIKRKKKLKKKYAKSSDVKEREYFEKEILDINNRLS